MTMEPTDTRASTQGDKGQPFRPQRNAIFERAWRMHPRPRLAARVHACVTKSDLFRQVQRNVARFSEFVGQVHGSNYCEL